MHFLLFLSGGPQIVVASSAEQGVSAGAWLQSIKLSACVDALALAGYDEDLDMILEADGEEVADMIAAVEDCWRRSRR